MPDLLSIVPYADRHARLEAVLSRGAVFDAAIEASVREILDAVRQRGDAALLELTERFDGVRPDALRVPVRQLDAALDALDPDLRAIFERAAANVRRFHQLEMPTSWSESDGAGATMGQRISPVERAGLYVPAGTAPLPSSVIMNAVPALVAGVDELHVCSPPGPDGLPHPLVMATARLLGIDHVYAVGGAQAIGALAFGTETVPRVDVVVGPGNAYVATAKKLVVGQVGIDSVAGPSEVVVLADEDASPTFAAADLLAQAEHDARASAVLVTPSAELAAAVAAEVERLTATLPRRSVLETSLPAYGAAIVTSSMDEAVACVDELAPEHLVILSEDADALWGQIRHAGAVFLGSSTPEPIGDYFAGPNHVLPTGGTARFASALSVNVFLRRQSVLRYASARLAADGPSVVRFAQAEGLDAHALAVSVRLEGTGLGVESSEFRVESSEVAGSNSSRMDTEGTTFRTQNLGTLNQELMRHLVRPEVRAEKAYRVPTTTEAEAKVDQNESPFELPESVKQAAIAEALATPWNRYPDDRPHRLIGALATRWDIPTDSLIVGHGSNEIAHTLGLCFLEAGTPVVLPHPMFALYASVARMHGARIVEVDPRPDLGHDASSILEAAVEADAPLTIVTTPNNPTGQSIPFEDLERLAAGVPGVLLIDEAYHEFVTGPTALELAKRHDNVLVMRTFSKAMGMAGVRIGTLVGAPELIQEIEKARVPFLVDRWGEALGLAMLDHADLIADRVRQLVASRDALFGWMHTVSGVEALPSDANFFLFRTPLPASALREQMAARGVLIRDVSGYPALAPRDGASGWTRVSIGTDAENAAFRAALTAVLHNADVAA